jgi:hypothetical protein
LCAAACPLLPHRSTWRGHVPLPGCCAADAPYLFIAGSKTNKQKGGEGRGVEGGEPHDFHTRSEKQKKALKRKMRKTKENSRHRIYLSSVARCTRNVREGGRGEGGCTPFPAPGCALARPPPQLPRWRHFKKAEKKREGKGNGSGSAETLIWFLHAASPHITPHTSCRGEQDARSELQRQHHPAGAGREGIKGRNTSSTHGVPTAMASGEGEGQRRGH